MIFKINTTKDNNNIKNRKTIIFFTYILNISLIFEVNHPNKNENNTITSKNKLIDNQNSKLVKNHFI